MDYARHMARVHHFAGWHEDLLHDIICDLLKKPEEKLQNMVDAKTKKMVNGVPTTELDKFVLSMLKMNACSPVGPFRKNTLGNKIISRSGNKVETQHTTEINGFDAILEEYDTTMNNKLDTMHAHNIHRLGKNGFDSEAIRLYNLHFIKNMPLRDLTETQEDSVRRIKDFLSITKKTLFDE